MSQKRKFQIVDEQGNPLNTIVAKLAFVEARFPGRFTDITPAERPKPKSVYDTSDFIAMIPKAKVRLIQAAAATNDDINVWIFNLPSLPKVNLNHLPGWFVDGIQGMVTEGIITQAQMNAFLEL
jgi:hypothetical protein